MAGDKTVFAERDRAWMTRALSLAERGRGWVEPNPMVGCIIAREGKALGEGWHRRFGGPHAEVEALDACRAAGSLTTGADAYVTLEPCSHHGKTPPCVDALLDARVARVFVAMVDPFEQVAGRGVARLRDAGVDVRIGLCADEARELNRAYLKRVTIGQPWVTAKWAQTIDGRIATVTHDSQWISNDESRGRVHELRGRVDAVMVGVGTVRADDPLLTARDVEVRRAARRVVVDPRLHTPPSCKLVQSLREDGPGVTIAHADDDALPLVGSTRGHEDEPAGVIAERASMLRDLGVELIALPLSEAGGGRLSLRPLLSHLAEAHQATNVLVEGGATLLGCLLAERLIDEAIVFLAPKLLGDSAALSVVTGFSRPRMKDADTWSLRDVERIGDDVMLTYRVEP